VPHCKGLRGRSDATSRYHYYSYINLLIRTCHYERRLCGRVTDASVDTCEYPGNITNGHVLLVGHMGKYEYRQYVQPVGHNDHG